MPWQLGRVARPRSQAWDLDPRTRKLLGRSPPVASAQVRTYSRPAASAMNPCCRRVWRSTAGILDRPPGSVLAGKATGEWFAKADPTAITPDAPARAYLRHGQQWGHMDPATTTSTTTPPPATPLQPTRTPTRSMDAGPTSTTTGSQPSRRPPLILLPPPGNGRWPRSPKSRAALECLDSRGRRRLTLDTCEIEPPTSAVNYPGRGSAAWCCAWASCRRLRGGRGAAPASPCSGGAGLLAAASWARYQVRRNDLIGLWPALGVGQHDRPVRTARSRVTAASSLAPLPPSWPDDHSVHPGPAQHPGPPHER
jgi:hypothetical protein